jgi:hypothetical protein
MGINSAVMAQVVDNPRRSIFTLGHLSLAILAIGVLAMCLPPAFFDYGRFPHWSVFIGYAALLLSALTARSSSERRMVLIASILVTVSGSWLCWDSLTFELLASRHTQPYHWVLRYLAPLTVLSIAIPCTAVLLSRRLRGR